MDFVHDQLATGTKIRILTIVDTFSRFSPVIDPKVSYRGEDVVQTLDVFAKRLAIQRQSVSIRGQSLSRAILICGPTTKE